MKTGWMNTISLLFLWIQLSHILGCYRKSECHISECCTEPWVNKDAKRLVTELRQRLHGQHLVELTVPRMIEGHLNNPQPQKALVLSFHGWTGGGKNFVARIIAEALYKEGLDSNFVHLFVSSIHFPHENKVNMYKDQLQSWVYGNVSLCPQSMFIFDDMDKMTSGVMDAIMPFMEHYKVNKVDFNRAIFIFLSNVGGSQVTQYTLDHWKSGKVREEMKLKDVEKILHSTVYNKDGGLQHSRIIEKQLVSAFIPFLPLERKHIELCITDDMKSKKIFLHPSTRKEIVEELDYFPPDLKIFSKSGCKRVTEKVDIYHELSFEYGHSEL